MTDDTTPDRQYRRRTVLKASAALGTASVIPGGAVAATAGLSPAVAEYTSRLGDCQALSVIERFDAPSWIVSVSDGDLTKLVGDAPGDGAGWVSNDPDRHEISRDERADTATIAAPTDQMGVRFWQRLRNDGLYSNEYVEGVDLDMAMPLADPVGELAPETYPLTNVGWREGIGVDVGALDSGVAYSEDWPDATITDVREATNATDTALGGRPDTSDITIAVIDTGVNAGSVFDDSLGATRILDASTDYTSSGEPTVGEDGLDAVSDSDGHGTWCAAAAAGDPADSAYQGYAPEADILAQKVLSDGSGSAATIARAVRDAADNGADVAVMSLGSPRWSETLDDALTYAAGADMVCAVAVGNSRSTTRFTASPSDADEAVSVGATTAEAASEAQSAAYSQVDPDPGTTDFSAGATQGSHIDVAAPGCRIAVQTPGGRSRLTGTSMATPCVAGGIALLYAADSSIRGDVEATKERLAYAQPVPAAGETEVGHGMLDVAAAINETDSEQTQSDARDSEAEGRDEAHRGLSRGPLGGAFAGWFQ